MIDLPQKLVHRSLLLRIGKGDSDQVRETLDWGANPNWRSRKGRCAIVLAVRGP